MSIGPIIDVSEEDEGEWAARHEQEDIAAEEDIVDMAENDTNTSLGAEETPQRHETAMELAVLGDTCPICLQALNDPVMVQSCYHVYCFECLTTWVHGLALHGVHTPTCPMCKVSFTGVYTDVRSEADHNIFSYVDTDRNQHTQLRERQRQREEDYGRRRRSIVYRKSLRLCRIGSAEIQGQDKLPAKVKCRGEYEEWLERELRACIGREIDVSVLVSIIQCCLDKVSKHHVEERYYEMEEALRPFLYDDATTFVRETAFFLGSRLNMHAYDDVSEYCCTDTLHCCADVCSHVN